MKASTPFEKAHLAGRNLVDPFNLLSISGDGAIAIGSDSHTPEDPGLRGYGNYIGVSFTQDMIGSFFGTFLIPSIDVVVRRIINWVARTDGSGSP